MANRSELEKNIELTRKKIDISLHEISGAIYKEISFDKKFKRNYKEILIGSAMIGIGLALISTKQGRRLIKLGMKPVGAVASAYVSKKIMSKFQIF